MSQKATLADLMLEVFNGDFSPAKISEVKGEADASQSLVIACAGSMFAMGEAAGLKPDEMPALN